MDVARGAGDRGGADLSRGRDLTHVTPPGPPSPKTTADYILLTLGGLAIPVMGFAAYGLLRLARQILRWWLL